MSEFFDRSSVKAVKRLLNDQDSTAQLIEHLEGFRSDDREATAGATDEITRPLTLALRLLRQGQSAAEVREALEDLSVMEEEFGYSPDCEFRFGDAP